MRRSYILGITIAIVLLITNQIIIQYWLYAKKYDATIINLAGNQRTLSQKITLEAYKVVHDSTSLENWYALVDEWDKAHKALLHGDDSYPVEPIEDQTIYQQVQQLSPNVNYIKQFDRKLIRAGEDILPEITQNQNEFLDSMSRIVHALETLSNSKLAWLTRLEIFLMFLAVVIIVLEVIYLYMPITKRLRKALRKARQFTYIIKAVNNSSTAAISYIDRDLNIRYGNKAHVDMNQLLYGEVMYEVANTLKELSEKNRQFLLKSYKQVLKGEIVKFNMEIKGYWWQFNLFPVKDNKNNIEGISQNISNISEQVKLQDLNQALNEKVDLIAKNFPNGSVTLIDKDLLIEYTNGDGYQTLGIDPNKWIGKPLSSLLTEDVLKKLLGKLDSVYQGNIEEYQANLSNRNYLVRLKPVFTTNSTVEKVVVISIDITDLIDYQNKLEIQNTKLSQIAWNQSHKVRGRVARVLGLLNLLEIENEDIWSNQYIQMIRGESETLDDIIHEIVEISSNQ